MKLLNDGQAVAAAALAARLPKDARRWLSRSSASAGQMTIELAVALPVMIAVAMICVNALTFFEQCAVFDRAAHEAVRVHAAAPAYGQGYGQTCALIEADVRAALGARNVQVSVAHSAAERDLDRYTATLEFSPTLFGMGLRSSVFGVSMPGLSHSSVYVVDSYKPGLFV